MSDEYVIQKEALRLFTQGLEHLKTNRLNPDFPKEGKIVEDDQLKIAQYRVLIRPSCEGELTNELRDAARTSPTPTGCGPAHAPYRA
jgi:hypothetical protein